MSFNKPLKTKSRSHLDCCRFQKTRMKSCSKWVQIKRRSWQVSKELLCFYCVGDVVRIGIHVLNKSKFPLKNAEAKLIIKTASDAPEKAILSQTFFISVLPHSEKDDCFDFKLPETCVPSMSVENMVSVKYQIQIVFHTSWYMPNIEASVPITIATFDSRRQKLDSDKSIIETKSTHSSL